MGYSDKRTTSRADLCHLVAEGCARDNLSADFFSCWRRHDWPVAIGIMPVRSIQYMYMYMYMYVEWNFHHHGAVGLVQLHGLLVRVGEGPSQPVFSRHPGGGMHLQYSARRSSVGAVWAVSARRGEFSGLQIGGVEIETELEGCAVRSRHLALV